MNVYRIAIWRAIYPCGVFSHNAERIEIIHARNEGEAKAKVVLRPKHVDSMGYTSAEFIYSIENRGTVEIVPYYIYSDGGGIPVSSYMHNGSKYQKSLA